MRRHERAVRNVDALDRLVQTRAEITGLIAPELAFADAQDGYMPPTQSRPGAADSPTAARRSTGDPEANLRAARLQAERDAVAAWADDVSLARPDRRTRNASSPMAGLRGFAGPILGPLLREGASLWWRRHPARAAFEVAGPALSHVAGRKPYLTLGLAAGAGALLVTIRPWRLVSITGLIVAVIKMTDWRTLIGSVRRSK